MTRLFGLLLALIGLVIIGGSLYTSLVYMLVGGIIDIINQIKAPSVSAPVVAWAVVKIIFCSVPFLGVWLGVIATVFGVTMLFDKPRPTHRLTLRRWNR